MKNVTCGRCRTKFPADLRRIPDSAEESSPNQQQREGVVELHCPHCKTQRMFLLCGLEQDEPNGN